MSKHSLEAQDSAPLVTVIVPTYNRAHLVETALNSVRAQTYRPIELIVVDDGSSDATADVVEAWLQAHSDASLGGRLVRQPNKGAPAARNNGLAYATGAFIQYLDSDDALAPRKIAAQVSALQANPDALFAWSGFRNVKSVDEVSKETRAAEWSFRRAPAPSMPGMIVRGLFRIDACRRIGPWNETLKRYQDWEYSIRYLALNAPAFCSPEVGYFVIAHGGQRIDDVSKDTRKKIECLTASAESAAAATSTVQNSAISIKIAQRYSMAMIESMRVADRPAVDLFIRRLRKYAVLGSVVRLKNEIVYGASLVLGPRAAYSLATRFF